MSIVEDWSSLFLLEDLFAALVVNDRDGYWNKLFVLIFKDLRTVVHHMSFNLSVHKT